MNKSIRTIGSGVGGTLSSAIRRRSLAVIAAASLCASAAMAQDDAGIKFGSWCTLNMSLVGYNGEDIVSTTTGASWGGQNARIGMDLLGVSKYAGFEICINADLEGGNYVGINDLAYGWVKPFDFLRVELGKVRDMTLERGVWFGSWNWMRAGSNLLGPHDTIFDMIGNGDGSEMHSNGMVAKMDFMENALHIGIGVLPGDIGGEVWKAEDAFAHRSAISAGYTVQGLGTFQAGVWMRDTAKDDDFANFNSNENDKFWAKTEVAFNLTAVENLDLIFAAKIPTGWAWHNSQTPVAVKTASVLKNGVIKTGWKDSFGHDIYTDLQASGSGGATNFWVDDGSNDANIWATKAVATGGKGYTYTEPFQLDVYASYHVLDNLTLYGLVGGHLYKYANANNSERKWDDDMAVGLRAAVGADIGVASDLVVVLDGWFCTPQYIGAYYAAGEADDDFDSNPGFSFLVGIKKVVSNGEIGIGFQGAINDGVINDYNTNWSIWWGAPVAKGVSYDGDAADADSFKFCVPIMMHLFF